MFLCAIILFTSGAVLYIAFALYVAAFLDITVWVIVFIISMIIGIFLQAIRSDLFW